MILFHGSNTAVPQIKLELCRPFRDFGTGFYLTPYFDQALRMASRVSRLYGGGEVVSSYSFNEVVTEDLNVRTFDTPSKEWALFVMNNRSKSFNNMESPDCNHDAKYDIVIGPVANDDMVLLFRQYMENLITLEMLARGMEFRHLNSQYSFHTKKALAALEFKGEVDE
ncbi:MAG: DUF3990 domain-containing protein [Coriobacteriia bacterium]|nr:DUF3990 domain-containing protein [Coriobacteriia bacterium]